MSCPCGAAGGKGRKDLAAHLGTAHGLGLTRAFLIADRLLEGQALTPEDQAVIAPPRTGPAPAMSTNSRRAADQAELVAATGIPSDEALNAAVAAAKLEPAAPLTRQALDTARTAAAAPARAAAGRAAEQIAKTLGAKPTHPMVHTVLEKTGALAGEEPAMPQGDVPGSQRKCGKCGEKGHRANRCGQAQAERPPRASGKRPRRPRPSRTALVPAGSSNGHAPSSATLEAARELLRKKVSEQREDLLAEVRALDRILAAVK